MSKKQDDFYFQNFIECAGYSCQAAHLLKEILSDFKPEDTRMRLDELHKIEHEADMKKHELSDRLTKAFITPIEREDIAALSEQIDDLTDNPHLYKQCKGHRAGSLKDAGAGDPVLRGGLRPHAGVRQLPPF